MGDVYVYDFYPFAVGGERSLRAPFSATLKAIESIGTPIMESQLVVDASQVTVDGRLISSTAFCSVEITRLSAEIRSLELRAAARELLILSLNADRDGAAIDVLSMESSHLRLQAQGLVIHRSDTLARESGHISEIMAFPRHIKAPVKTVHLCICVMQKYRSA